MLSIYLIRICFAALVLGGLCHIIGVFMKSLPIEIISLVFLGISLINGLGGLIEKEIALKTSSSSYYYDMLEKKTSIEEQIKAHEEKIEVLHSGEIDDTTFKNKNEIISLNNAIKRYNDTILKHQEYKNSYWFNERYNEAVAKLNTFEEIFKEVN